MILINTKPIDDALNDFFENNDTGSALYRLNFDEVFIKVYPFSQDENETNLMKVKAFNANGNMGDGFAFMNLNTIPLNANVLNFMTWHKLEGYKSFVSQSFPTINNINYNLYNVLNFRILDSTQTLPKQIVSNFINSIIASFTAYYFLERFTEESLRAHQPFIAYYLARYLLEILHYNLIANAGVILVNSPIFPQPSLNATNIKDVMHYYESYLYASLEGPDDRLVFMLHPLDYQQLLRLKDSAGNYVFCSNCVWDNVIEVGKSIIVNASWHQNAANNSLFFSPNQFLVFPKSKFRFIYSGDLYFKIVRDSTNNTYALELYVPCLGLTGPFAALPYAPFTFFSYLLLVNYPTHFGVI